MGDGAVVLPTRELSNNGSLFILVNTLRGFILDLGIF